MRLWASIDSITFDEIAPKIGLTAEVSFGLLPDYIHLRAEPHSTFACNFPPLGPKGLRQVPELGRAMTCLNGKLIKEMIGSKSSWSIESAFLMRLNVRRDPLSLRICEELTASSSSAECETMGTLSMCGTELRSASTNTIRPIRFLSMCLNAASPLFGTWSEVQKYGSLGSDPDVIGAPVLLAEFELLI